MTSLISCVSDTGESEYVCLPRVQLSNDIHTNLLYRRVQVHHLVCDTQLVNEFLQRRQFNQCCCLKACTE